MIKVVLSSLARIWYTTSIMTHKRMKRWFILKKCQFLFHQLSYDTLSVQLYSRVYTLMDVSHIRVMFVHHGSVDFRQGIKLFMWRNSFSNWKRVEPGTEIIWPCGCFFCSDPLVCLPIRLLARETIPGPERKKDEVAIRWWILAVCFIRTPIEWWIDHSDKLAFLRLQMQASYSKTMLSMPYFLSDKM